MEKQLATIEKALARFGERCKEIFIQETAIETSICNTVRQLHETLDARKTELISQLNQLTQAKIKSLAVQRQQIETVSETCEESSGITLRCYGIKGSEEDSTK